MIETVWCEMDNLGTDWGQADGVFVQISEADKARLTQALLAEAYEDAEYASYYTERIEATHWFIAVQIPRLEDYTPDFLNTECTWWDFDVILAKQVDGVWYGWSEDPGDIGNIWYQSPYTREQAYSVRDLCIKRARDGNLYTDPDCGYLTQGIDECVDSILVG